MNRLSIKLRVTLWYTALMLLLTALVLGFMVFVSNSVAASNARDTLIRAVEDNIKEVEYDDGVPEIDDDFAYFKNGVSSVVYTSDFRLVDGHFPGGFVSYEPLADGSVRTVSAGSQQFYIYDRAISFKKHDDLWIRGIIAVDGSTGIIGTVLKAAFILLPFIVLFAALIGYQITKNAFRPIDEIARAAGEISEGSDLSKRINLGEGTDEIHRLAETFDGMFSRLEASFEAEKQFSSDVSHELRTPAAVILSQCEVALQHASTEAEYREALETVQRQAGRMSRLISQLLSFTRLEQGVEKASLEDTDVSELVEMALGEHTAFASKGIVLTQEIEPGIHALVDRSLFIRLVSNLVSNAYQYGKENGTVHVRLAREDGNVRLTVSDDGIGIAREHQDKIWRRFYQVDASRTVTAGEGSMGLGLAMVRQIAQLHGGHVTVTSAPDEGSAFDFLFPLPGGHSKNHKSTA